MAYSLVIIYLALIYVRPQEYLTFLAGVPVLPAFLALSFAVWLTMPRKNFESPQFKLLPVLLVVMCLSVLASGWAGGALAPVADFGPSVILFYLLATTQTTLERHQRTIRVIASATTVLAIHGIDQARSGIGWSGAMMSQETRITYVGIFSDPNDLALAFVIALPLLWYALTESRRFLGKVYWVGCIGATLYAIYLTNSRGGLLGAGGLMLLLFRARFGTLLSAIGAGAGLALFAMLPSRLSELDAKEESAAGRLEAWYEGIKMLQSHPLLGVGKGNFTDHHHLTAHNSFVLVFAELGFVGYLIWVGFVGISAYMVYRLVRSPMPQGLAEGEPRALWSRYHKVACTYSASLIGFFMCAFFLSRGYVVLLVIVCALCTSIYQAMRAIYPTYPRMTISGALGGIVLFAMGSLLAIYLLVRILHH